MRAWFTIFFFTFPWLCHTTKNFLSSHLYNMEFWCSHFTFKSTGKCFLLAPCIWTTLILHSQCLWQYTSSQIFCTISQIVYEHVTSDVLSTVWRFSPRVTAEKWLFYQTRNDIPYIFSEGAHRQNYSIPQRFININKLWSIATFCFTMYVLCNSGTM